MKQYLPPAATAAPASATPKGRYPVIGGQTIELGQLPVLAPNYTNNTFVVGSVDYTIGSKGPIARPVHHAADQHDRHLCRAPCVLYHRSFERLPGYAVRVPQLLTVADERIPAWLQPPKPDVRRGPQQFPGLDQFPNVTINELGINIGPNPVAPQGTIQNTYQGTDNLSWIKGSPYLEIRRRLPQIHRARRVHAALSRRLRVVHAGRLPARSSRRM